MNRYFAFIDGEQRGPFEPDQLSAAGVRPSTYVWCKGMADWQRADSVDEIRRVFTHHITHRHETPVTPEPSDAQPVEAVPAQELPPEPDRIRFGRIPDQGEPQPNLDNPPQVSMTLAVLSLILCFPPTGILAVLFAYRAQKAWNDSNIPGADVEALRIKAHENERLAKMWLGLTLAFGIIAWTLVFSIPRR